MTLPSGPPAEQPGPPGPVPPAPPKKSNTLRTVLIIAAAVAVLCCAGLAGFGIWVFVSARNSIGPARDVAVSFVEDLEANNASEAYNRLCPAVRNQITREEFIVGTAAQPTIVSHKVTGVNVHNDNGITTADIRMVLTLPGGQTEPHTFPMLKQNGTWYVCGNPY
jgi:hypothetical protein